MAIGASPFTVPSGWTVERAGEISTLVGPEGDLRVSFVELESPENIQQTALAAWKAIDPTFSSTVLREVASPPMGSWREMHQVIYEVPASESRMEIAVIRLFGARAYVNLIRGTTAGIGRRGAQLNEVIGSWKPAGYEVKSLKDAVAPAWKAQQSRELEEFVLKGLAVAKVPGVAIGIVQDGRLVYAQGFGVRSVEGGEPVTLKTRFMIGSTTKPLTTLMMAKMADQQKLSWSTPVVDLLPEFALADPEITKRLELHHTVSASTGMPRQDAEFVFKYTGVTGEDRIAQMKTMRPTTGFGETFQYSNFLVAAGGYAAARAFDPARDLESAYESAFQALVSEPLAMNDTVFKQEDAVQGDVAHPHALNFDGNVESISFDFERAVYSVAPAGAAFSTVGDIAKYMLLELGKGAMPDGSRFISEEALLERRKKRIKIDAHNWYGLGLLISDEAGLEVLHHGGNTLGFTSDMYFLPGKNLGVVVLTNVNAANLFLAAVRQKIFEMLFQSDAKSEKTLEAAGKIRSDGLALVRGKTRTDRESIAWIGELVGKYSCEELGSAEISEVENGFRIEFAEWSSALGSEVESGGGKLIRLLSPPWSGSMKFLVDPDMRTLTYDGGQRKYLFLKDRE